MFTSLRFRLTLLFIMLTVGPLVVVAIIVGQRSYDNLVQQSLALQQTVAASVGSKVSAFIEGQENELFLLSQVQGLEILPLAEQRRILSNLLLHQQYYQEIALLDSAGQERIRLSRSGVILNDEHESRATRDEFLFPVTQGRTYFGPVRFDQTIREPLITVSISLVDLRQGEISSVLVADLRFKAIWDLLATVELPAGQDVYLVDREGRVIAHRNPSVVLSGATVDLSQADGRAVGLSGEDVIIARDALQFGDQELMVVAEQAISNALALAARNMQLTVMVTLVALALAVLVAVFTADRIVRPIEALASSAQAISSGDFSQQVEVSGQDEIAELTQAFNSMNLQLQQTLAGLEQEVAIRKQAEEVLQQHSERLEEMVEQRTQELREAQAELVRQERLSALGQLAATVAHEMRNPLGTVRTCVFGIGDAIERDDPERAERALQLAERNILRCDNIISDLLDYTRDRMPKLKSTNIDAWLDAVLDEQTIPEDIVCTRELNTGIEIPIDGEHLRRAVVNVVDNALDALRDDAAPDNRLFVSTQVVREPQVRAEPQVHAEPQGRAEPQVREPQTRGEPRTRLEIRVKDTGPGIPDDVLDRVFEPLFSTKRFGIGLGMPIVKNIMEQHGGGVEITTQRGQQGPGRFDSVRDLPIERGTSVTLWLPISNEERD